MNDAASIDGSAEDERLRLQFHHNVVEHLGLRLYHNKADKVICELVSNSWDADSTNVDITLTSFANGKSKILIVADDGVGMDRKTLQQSYLTISAPRRGGANEISKTNGGRLLMGRKGIGKLAPFGICRTVDVITGNPSSGYHWLSLNLDDIQKAAPAVDSSQLGKYLPPEHARGVSLEDIEQLSRLPELRDAFLSRVRASASRAGTAIGLTDINDRVGLGTAAFKRAVGRRFTVTLARPDFKVVVDGEPLSDAEIYPQFDHRIPAVGFAEDEIGSHKVRYWIGFTSKPVSRGDESGIGVFAHGKIAQDRPYWFEMTGNDLWLPYTYGVVEADWLDDFSEDIISTDRTAVDWEHPQAALLKAWGQKNLRRWIAAFEGVRQDREKTDNERMVRDQVESGSLPPLTSVEQKSLVELLSDVSPNLPPDPEVRGSFASALADAWLHKPARDMIKSLWEQFKVEASGASSLASTISALREYMVPEALSVSVTFAQRAFALTVLYELIHLGKEPDLQQLIESFPWIVGPECEYLTANETLRSMVREAREKGLIPRSDDIAPIKETIKPDFVFLTNATETEITVVELKSPQNSLTLENRVQLDHYMTFIESKYPGAKRRGILIGNAAGSLEMPRSDTELRSWNSVFVLARSAYTIILASMLKGYADNPNDPRLKDVHAFGGEPVWKLLTGLASKDEELARLLKLHAPQGS